MEYILKNAQKLNASVLIRLLINGNENQAENGN